MVLGHSMAWELQEEDQGHPIKSFGSSEKKRTLIFFTNAMFSCLHGKISVNLGKSLQAFLPLFSFNTLGSLPLLFLNPVFVGALQPGNNVGAEGRCAELCPSDPGGLSG